MSEAQVARLRAVEAAYRSGDPQYPALRDAAATDPVLANWLVRMFIRDVFAVREGRPLGKDEDLLRAAARIQDPVEARALAEIQSLGLTAVPVVVGDLLRHEQPQPRELGIELIGRIGAVAVPALQDLARDGEPRHRRAAARALGAVGQGAAGLEVLRELAGDQEYTVRADAVRSLRQGGVDARSLLIDRLRSDPDPFVRRVAAQSLAGFPGAASAQALIDHLERCKHEGDFAGQRTPDAWRAYAQGLTDSEPGR